MECFPVQDFLSELCVLVLVAFIGAMLVCHFLTRMMAVCIPDASNHYVGQVR